MAQARQFRRPAFHRDLAVGPGVPIMENTQVNLSIGVPVRNGARFIRKTLDSLLAQTYRDFELIISDNASTDATEEICREYATRDSRVRYLRAEKDRGLAGNHNFLVEQARGKYFKWAAGDDMHKPEYVARCLEVLEKDPTVVMAYAPAQFIDAEDNCLSIHDPGFNLQADSACERLRRVIYSTHWVNAIFGVMRMEAVRRTRLFPAYPGGDYAFLGELSLHGKFIELPEKLFLRRLHPGASSQNIGNLPWEVRLWTGRDERSRPFWALCSSHRQTICQSSLPVGQKLSLLGSLGRAMISGRQRLIHEIAPVRQPRKLNERHAA